MSGLNYELLFLESLKLVVRPGHPLLQETVTLSRVMEWPVVVSPKGNHSAAECGNAAAKPGV
ncbi:LysR family transcriptional regulator YdcI [Raoultella ornithinolytica]|nr:LysR family transcriptional regulator YdcI [Raoultella ornithinolytica]